MGGDIFSLKWLKLGIKLSNLMMELIKYLFIIALSHFTFNQKS